MSFTPLDFRKAGFRVPQMDALGQVNKLVDKDKARLLAHTVRQDGLLANMQNRQLEEKKLAMQAKRDAAVASDRKKALLAETAGNDAMMKAMLPSKSTEDIITEKDATASVMADPTLLARLAQNTGTLTPFMTGQTLEEQAAIRAKAEAIGTKPVEDTRSWWQKGIAGSDIMASDGGGVSANVYGRTAKEVQKKKILDTLVQNPNISAQLLQNPKIIGANADEDVSIKENVAAIMSEGADNTWNKEAGVPVTQKDIMVNATTDSMINSLMESYNGAKTPRGKNAIANKILTLRASQAATAAENKKYTHDINKIKVKGLLDPEDRPETTTTAKADPRMLRDAKEAAGLKDQDWSGKITNAMADYGTFTTDNVRKYETFVRKASSKLGRPIGDAQLAAAIPYLKNTNSLLDDTMTMSPEEFLDFALQLPATSVKTKN